MTISLDNKSTRLLFISRTGIAVGGILAVTMASGLWRLRNFVENELAPLAEESLTNILKRPIELGDVQGFSLAGVQFGTSMIPQTATDPDRVIAEAVEVGFDPLQLLFHRKLKLDVTLVNPDVYIEQDERGVWVDTSINNTGREGFIKIDLDKLRLHNANLVLVPYRPQEGKVRNFPVPKSQGVTGLNGNKSAISLKFDGVHGIAQLSDDYQLVKFRVKGNPALGGSLALEGEARPRTLAFNFNLKAREIFASDITRLIPLPVNFQAGRARGDLNIQWSPGKQALLFGRADFEDLNLKVPQAPKAFVKSHGRVHFDGLKMTLRDVTTNYGKLPLVGQGTIHTANGYDLKAKVNGIDCQVAQKTLGFTLPIDTTGLLKADLKLTGKLYNPLLLGNVRSIEAAKIDKVNLKSASGQFSFTPTSGLVKLTNLRGEAALGGQAIGGGIIQLGEQPEVKLNFQAKNFSGDAIAKLYKTIPPIRIGNVGAQVSINGVPSSAQTKIQFRAPQATYPMHGEVVVAPDKSVSFRDVKLAMAGGRVKVRGNWNEKAWKAIADADGVQVERFANPELLENISLGDAKLKGRLIITGKSNSFGVATIRSQSARISLAGGTVAISEVELNEQEFNAKLVANEVQLAQLLEQVSPFDPLDASLDGSLQISGSRQETAVKNLRVRGEGKLNLAGGTVNAKNIELNNGSYGAKLFANNIQLAQLVPQLSGQLQGLVKGEFDITGSAESFSPSSIKASGNAQLNLPGGAIYAKDIQIANGQYQTKLEANKIPLEKLAPQLPKQFQGQLTGEFNLAGSLKSLQTQGIHGQGEARLDVGRGTLTASNIKVVGDRYRTQINARNLPLQSFAPVPSQVQGDVNGELKVTGSLESLQPEDIKKHFEAVGEAKLNVAGGEASIDNIQIAKGNYQAFIDASGVQLNQFHPELQGQLQGNLQITGKLSQLNLAGAQAAGKVKLSQGIPGIERPLQTTFAWNGERLNIKQAEAPGFSAKGYISANAETAGMPEITNLNLDIIAKDYNLNSLPLNLPKVVRVAGKADFQGKVTGKLPVPNVQGQISVKDLRVNQLDFEPLLNGDIQVGSGGGFNLNVAGQNDRIAFNLDRNQQPRSFSVRHNQAFASGKLRGNNLAIKTEKIPLKLFNLNLPPTSMVGPGSVAGSLSGNFQVNKKTFATTGDLTIDQPQIGRIEGDRLLAKFNLDRNKLTLKNSSFIKGKSKYEAVGTIIQGNQGPQLKGEINVNQGKAQDVLAAFQLFELEDFQHGFNRPTYGKAGDLGGTQVVGLANQSLYTQLQRFSEVKERLNQQKQQEQDASPLPKVADLKGTFDTKIKIDTLTTKEPKVEFNFQGKDFAWGKKNQPGRFYNFEQIIAQGKLDRGILQLRPLRIESKNQLIAFTGNIGGTEQFGQLRVNNFPLQMLNNFVELPVSLNGNINATAALSGSVENPQARGELEITDGYLNQQGLHSASASFSYSNGRLNFGSDVAITSEEPVRIKGSIPYQLYESTFASDNKNIQLDLQVKDRGLALLNLFTDRLTFEEGKGKIDVSVRGTLEKPEAIGLAKIENATFSAQALPEKITGVTGNIDFDFDRIIVNNLQGQFSKGKIAAVGVIPIFNDLQTQIENPLKIDLEKLTLNMKGLYEGGVSGGLEITGSIFDPKVGGKVELSNGKVLLAESSEPVNSDNDSLIFSSLKSNKADEIMNGESVTRFNNLQLTLGKNLEITRPPILNFKATGELNLTGSLEKPIPEGKISLKKGNVNLFTTQFKLARGEKNTATFRKNRPNDPDLDIHLFAKVLDTIQTTKLTRENITGLSALESVRVEANIEGPASKLKENLELTSSPARSKTEIVSLLGGGFVNTQGRGESTLGLINIAGSAVFNNLQSTFNQIGTAFGLSEFRVFPTIISEDREAGRNYSSLEIAAEAGIDITKKISVSGIKILTDDDPFQWGVNYRVNDRVRLRGSTNLFDDTRVFMEYQKRF